MAGGKGCREQSLTLVLIPRAGGSAGIFGFGISALPPEPLPALVSLLKPLQLPSAAFRRSGLKSSSKLGFFVPCQLPMET